MQIKNSKVVVLFRSWSYKGLRPIAYCKVSNRTTTSQLQAPVGDIRFQPVG